MRGDDSRGDPPLLKALSQVPSGKRRRRLTPSRVQGIEGTQGVDKGRICRRERHGLIEKRVDARGRQLGGGIEPRYVSRSQSNHHDQEQALLAWRRGHFLAKRGGRVK